MLTLPPTPGPLPNVQGRLRDWAGARPLQPASGAYHNGSSRRGEGNDRVASYGRIEEGGQELGIATADESLGDLLLIRAIVAN